MYCTPVPHWSPVQKAQSSTTKYNSRQHRALCLSVASSGKNLPQTSQVGVLWHSTEKQHAMMFNSFCAFWRPQPWDVLLFKFGLPSIHAHLLLELTEWRTAHNEMNRWQLQCPPAQAIPLQHKGAALPKSFSLCSTTQSEGADRCRRSETLMTTAWWHASSM